VVIAVSSQRLAEWIEFAGAMTAKVTCDRLSLDCWWRNVLVRIPGAINEDRQNSLSE
jgi:hypothetical protein